jgi:hypothetical protein
MLQKAPVDRLRIVEKIWHEFLGDDMVMRPRFSRIYNNGRYFKYPLEPFDALSKLGLWESAACGMSFPNSLLLPQRPELTFDAWVSNRFGKRLFRTWGIPCSQIDASWAAQRISGLSGLSLLTEHAPTRAASERHGDQDFDPFFPVSAAGSRDDVGGMRQAD